MTAFFQESKFRPIEKGLCDYILNAYYYEDVSNNIVNVEIGLNNYDDNEEFPEPVYIFIHDQITTDGIHILADTIKWNSHEHRLIRNEELEK